VAAKRDTKYKTGASSKILDLKATIKGINLGVDVKVQLEKADRDFINNFAFVVERWRSQFNAKLPKTIAASTFTRSGGLSSSMSLIHASSPSINKGRAAFNLEAKSSSTDVDSYAKTMETGRPAAKNKKGNYFVPLASWLLKSGSGYKTSASIESDLMLPKVYWTKEFKSKGGNGKARLVYQRNGKGQKNTAMYIVYKTRATAVYGDSNKRKRTGPLTGAMAMDLGLDSKQNSPRWFSRAAAKQLPRLYSAIDRAILHSRSTSNARAGADDDLQYQFNELSKKIREEIG
jgi:hypothetical protein